MYLNKSKPLLCGIVAISVILFVLPFAVRAETGSITAVDEKTKAYDIVPGGAAAFVVPDWTTFFFRNSAYNGISRIVMNNSNAALGKFAFSFLHSSELTFFTCSSGGTCAGTADYDASTGNITWFFDSGATITSNRFTLSYTKNIFANVTVSDTPFGNLLPGILDDDHPVWMRLDDTHGWTYTTVGGPTVGVAYIVDVSTSVTNNFNVTYPASSPQQFIVNITKPAGSIPTAITIKNVSGTNYFVEPTFNTLNMDFLGTYNKGIVLALSTSAFCCQNVTVNTTGAAGFPTPTPTPPPGTSGTFVITDKTDYSLFDTATVFWGIDSSIFNFLFNFKVDVIKPDGVETTIADNVAQTGNLPYQFVQSGNFQFELIKCTIGICLSPSVIATFNANVATPHPYIYAPNTVLANQQFNVTYSYDRNPLSVAEFEFIDVFNAKSGVHESSVLTTIDTNKHVIINFTLPAVAPYVLCLENLAVSSELTTCANVNVIAGAIPPTQNISTPLINLTKSTYWFGDTLAGYYQIDNNNYSRTDGGTIFWDIFDTDTGVESMHGNIGSQAENFSLLIKNDPEVYRWDNQIVHLPAQFFAGNNQFRIFAKNATTTVQIASAPFSISNTNAAGWGLSLSKYTVQANEVFQIFITAPSAGSLILNPGATTIPISGSMTLSRAVSNTGLTFIDLYDSSTPSRIQASVILNVTAAPSVTVTTSGQQQASDLANLLTSNLFWALLMTAAFMIAIAVAQRGKSEG